MNVLAIGAHFDDVELGCGGSLAKHVSEGDKVYIYVATVSGFSNHNAEVVRDNDVALQEGKDSMDIMGVHGITCGRFKTLGVEFVDALNIEIIQVVEKWNIGLVYIHWTGDIHHDHKAVAQASLHSCRHVQRILMYRSNWYHSSQDFHGNFYVDITDYWEIKEKAIRAHLSEVERTGNQWIRFFKNEAVNAGQRIGVEYAEVFEIVKWLQQ